MKIGVYGSAGELDSDTVSQKAMEIGREAARRNHTIVTGACDGFPYDVVRGAHELGGHVIGYTPAADLDEHINHYEFPLKGHSEYVFIPADFKHRGNKAICYKLRNVLSTADVDAAIIVGGGTGTMHEFISSYDFGKRIGVFEGSGGITDEAIRVLLQAANKDDSKIIWEADPKLLVQRLTE